MPENKSTTMQMKGQESFILNQRELVLSTKQEYSITVEEMNTTHTSLDHRLRDPKA